MFDKQNHFVGKFSNKGGGYNVGNIFRIISILSSAYKLTYTCSCNNQFDYYCTKKKITAQPTKFTVIF